MDDKKIIELYFARSREALGQAEEQYGPYCRAVARNILGSDQEAEACAADALRRSWEVIPPQRPDRLSVFLGKITRTLALDRWATCRGKKRGDGEALRVLSELAECADGEEPEREAEEKVLTEAVAAYLRTQPMPRRMVFIRRYWYCNTVPVIARQLSMTEERVQSILQQTRRELKARLPEAAGRETLLRAMNDLPEDLIAEGNVRRRHPLVRIAAVAVCLLVLASGLYPYFRGRGQSGDRTAVGVTVNGACYEIWAPGSTAAQRTGLPDVIGQEMAGIQVEEIDQGTVHLYLPAENQRAVYLLKRADGAYQYLIFAGYSASEGPAHVAADQMFLTYGVTKPEDLAAVTWGEETVTDRETLDAVYQALTASEAYGQEEFSRELDDGQGGEAVWLEAANGLRWRGTYSETAGVFSWCGNYYRLGDGPLVP